MLDWITAIRFDGRVQTGRTMPCKLACEPDAGDEVEVVAKLSGGCERGIAALLSEAIAAMLAADLDLPVPEPFLVKLDAEFIATIQRNLEERQVLKHFQPKKIAVQDDEIEFEYAWKNGVWHCLEPLSFDLMAADGIREKAHRWFGQIASLRDAADPFKVYLLVGAPQQERLRPAFVNAMSILRRIPGETEIVLEQDAPALAARIAKEVELHPQP